MENTQIRLYFFDFVRKRRMITMNKILYVHSYYCSQQTRDRMFPCLLKVKFPHTNNEKEILSWYPVSTLQNYSCY